MFGYMRNISYFYYVKGNKNKNKATPFDMKNILGYLNQGENLQTLSIGSIMQLQPFKLRDLVEEGKNEFELDRKSTRLNSSHSSVSRMPSSA